jgi:RHS repeat-associated protein
LDYAYDPSGTRISLSNNGILTKYPTPYFNEKGSKKTEHIFANGVPVASIKTTGSGSDIFWNHQDHLGSTRMVTATSTAIVEDVNYLAFGSIANKTGIHKEQLKFTGHEYDTVTEYTYAKARYLNTDVGRFLSEDPAFNAIGSPALGQIVGMSQEAYLSDPQGMNSYSYVKNNPLNHTDPTGQFWWKGFYNWQGYSGISGVLMKAGEVFGGHARGLDAIQKNQGQINGANDPNLVSAVIYEEQSHLTLDEALGREYLFPNVGEGGVGVMQVSGEVGAQFGYTKTELARDPQKNISTGSGYLNSISQKLGTNDPASIGTAYNGSSLYGQRIAAQYNDPYYNMNIFVYQLQQIVNSLQSILDKYKNQ